MTEAIRLYWGRFGHVSVLNVASDFVTHAHVEAHLIIWLEGTAGEMTIGRETVRLGPGIAAGINSFQPHSHALSQMAGTAVSRLLHRSGLGAPAPTCPPPRRCSHRAIPLEPWLHRAAICSTI
jgi:hypothetical protein